MNQMIKLDQYGLIGQHRPGEPNYLDMGDSCMKTSLAVIGGIISDKLLGYFLVQERHNELGNYLLSNKVIRSPSSKEYSDPKKTSRDQLICFMAALALTNHKYVNKNIMYCSYKYRINKDLLISPSIRWFMRKCEGDDYYSWLGDKMIRLDIWWASKNTDKELNQLFCMCLVLGKDYVKLLCDSHPDWRKNLRDYWCGWRDQAEIGEAFIKRIERNL